MLPSLAKRDTRVPQINPYGTISGTNEEEVVAITASEARRALFPLIEKVNDDRSAIEITSKRGNAVLMSAADYAAWQETAYLFRSPANARRLLDAADAAERGELAEHPLDLE
jgi:antitoxin YefM